MKVLVWCATAEDCRVFEQYNKGRIEFEYTPDTLTEENVSSCKGYEGIVIQTRCIITEKVAALLAEAGVKFIACRSAGFDHVNLAAIKKYGIKACNVPLFSKCHCGIRRHGIYDGAAEGKKAAAHDRKRRLYLKRSARPGTA